MKNKLEYFLFISLSKFVGIIGLKNARKFASVLAVLFYYVIPIRKETVIDNLEHAFPDYSSKKIKDIAYGSYKSFAIALVEILYFPYIDRKGIDKQVKCINKNLIHDKQKLNKGVIILSAHFGNWEYNATSIGAKLNLPVSVVVKPQRNPYVTEWMNKMRTKWTNKIVPLGVSIRKTYKALLDKNIVAMIADQRGPQEGIRVTFFGRKAAVYSGPAALAIKTGAPILYGIAVRQPDNSYVTEMVEIDMNDLPDDDEEKIIELSRRHTNYLEKIIREHPEQWLWMHKRWKY